MPGDQTNTDHHIDDPFDLDAEEEAARVASQQQGELDDEELDDLFDLDDLDSLGDDEEDEEEVEGEGPDA